MEREKGEKQSKAIECEYLAQFLIETDENSPIAASSSKVNPNCNDHGSLVVYMEEGFNVERCDFDDGAGPKLSDEDESQESGNEELNDYYDKIHSRKEV
jgi:hypothetical protein